MTEGPDRDGMLQAIDAMRRSIAERRADGKVPPRVGAVIVLPDGTRLAACRGELREGDHAEFTLLERKLRDRDLTGSTLYATLEPCAPGARQPPKRSCSERIVIARVRKVWVGIEDPDPTVDRRGIKFLQDNGIEVEMFDLDLQRTIREENEAFLLQAQERADEAVPDETVTVSLSSLEQPLPQVHLPDLSTEALESYREVAEVPDAVGTPEFNRRLERLGIFAKDADGAWVPTKAGIVLFGREPRVDMPQVGLLGTIHYPDGSEETEDFDGPQVLASKRAMDWLRNKLPNTLDRTQARSQRRDESLFKSMREGIVNALVHRDYDSAGAKSQLVVRPDAVEIRSPGLPVEPVTLQQLQEFNAPMLSRNPLIHFVFRQMKLAEERGLGLKTMRRLLLDAGLPAPIYTYDAPYLVLTIFRSAEAAAAGLSREVQGRLSEIELAGWNWLLRQLPRWVQTSEYVEALGRDAKAARRDLNHLADLGLAVRSGETRARRYRALRPPGRTVSTKLGESVVE